MPSNTDHLELITHTLADTFEIQDYTDNWQTIDAHPGLHICTSITRPTWDTPQEGMSIFETDTGLIFTWDGTDWQRYVSRGWIDGEEVDDDVATSSTTPVEAIAVTVTVAEGNRRHLVVVHAPGVYSTEGLTELTLYRDANVLQQWYHQGWTGGDPESYPRAIFAVVPDTPAAGSVEYSLALNAVSGIDGTSTIIATPTKPLAIDVFEM